MGFWDRIEIAMNSPLGGLLIILFISLLGLIAIYTVLMLRRREKDRFAYYFAEHFSKLKQMDLPFEEKAAPVTGFFAREALAQHTSSHAYGTCLIFPPELSQPEHCERLSLVQRALRQDGLEFFSEYTWISNTDVAAILELKTYDPFGVRLMSLHEYARDFPHNEVQRENILLTLAQAIARLHHVRLDNGDFLYHGFLLPQLIYVELDPLDQVQSIVVSKAGLAYIFGARKVYDRLEDAKNGKLVIDRIHSRELIESTHLLAPEQMQRKRLDEVGRAADIYAFATIAVELLSGKTFVSKEQVDWSKFSEQWADFLKLCLQDAPELRPQDLMELKDRLMDSDLQLSLAQAKQVSEDEETPLYEEGLHSLEELPDLLRKVQSKQGGDYSDINAEGNMKTCLEKVHAGYQALKLSRWSVAQQRFLEALNEDNEVADAHIGLAIALYELGDLKLAQKYHEKATVIDPKSAVIFREYTAFRV